MRMAHHSNTLEANNGFSNLLSHCKGSGSLSPSRDFDRPKPEELEFHILDGIDCAVVLIDKNHEICWLNEEMEHLFGVRLNDALGMHALFFLSAYILPHIDEAERFGREVIGSFMEKSEFFTRRYRVSGGDPAVDYIEYSVFWVSRGPLEGLRMECYRQVKEGGPGDGQVTLKELLNREIRRNKALTKKMETLEYQQRTLHENVCDIIWMTDTNLRVTYVSPSIRAILHWDADEVKGMRLDDLFTEESAVCARMMWYEMIDEWNAGDRQFFPWKVELQGKCRDGSPKWIEINSVCIGDEDRTPVGILGIARDISARRKIEDVQQEAYRQIERNIEQFATLNDQIRNPLQAIVGLADLQGGEIAEMIFEQAREIDDIIKKLDKGWVDSEKIRTFLHKHSPVACKITPR
jgi:PAS domain S-box-containing protein